MKRVIEELRAENRAGAEDLRRWERELRSWDEAARQRVDASMENDKRVTREIALELQKARSRDRAQRDEMRTQREGLLRTLHEMRRDDGPSPAGA